MWRRRTLAAVSVVLLLALSAHPELFSIGTLVDALGIDGLWLLLDLQLTGVLLPGLLTGLAWCRPYLRPVGRAIGDFLRDCGGPVGQYGYLWLTTRTRAA
ncbi:MAG: hypothetical protein ABT19_06780 [Rhodanobacter sp. SCN 68-63]|jgi:hypothetical protein|nr:MAG: hypothetical protein ABT19_06780 [Rhodanobacter sp. SCN 68-63]